MMLQYSILLPRDQDAIDVDPQYREQQSSQKADLERGYFEQPITSFVQGSCDIYY
jgi:hypothetical protein